MTHPAMTVIYSSHQTSIRELSSLVATAAKALYNRTAAEGLMVAGPVYWIYYGMDGNPETRFTLEIAIPVTGNDKADDIASSKELPSAQYLTTLHRGPWEKLEGTYTSMMEHAKTKNLVVDGVFREIYLNIDLANPENHIMVVQAGLGK